MLKKWFRCNSENIDSYNYSEAFTNGLNFSITFPIKSWCVIEQINQTKSNNSTNEGKKFSNT